MVEAAPAPSFKMSQPDLLLELLIVAFDPPSQLGNVDEVPPERNVFRKRRQPIFDRLVVAIGPFNQQPLLRPTVGEPVIPMRDTNAHTGKSRGQLLPRAFPPCDCAPGTQGRQAARDTSGFDDDEAQRGSGSVNRGNEGPACDSGEGCTRDALQVGEVRTRFEPKKKPGVALPSPPRGRGG